VGGKSVFLNFKIKEFSFDGQACSMMIIKDKTSQIAVDRLKHNNHMMQMQASCVSHDMRAPLGTIEYLVEAVLTKKGVSSKIKKLLKPVGCAAKILNM
jgi:K+-sensing histidine kinase KdpD